MDNEDLPYAAMVKAISEAYIYADRQGIIRWWSDGAERLFGFTREEALGQSLDLIIPEKLRDAHWKGFNAALETGNMKHYGKVLTTRSLHKVQEKIYVDLSFHLVKDETGKVLGSSAIGRLSPPRQPVAK
jgi:PAS domain S-box-containing protein